MKFLTDLHEDRINLSGLTITAIELEFFKNFSNFLLFFKYIKFNLFENFFLISLDNIKIGFKENLLSKEFPFFILN